MYARIHVFKTVTLPNSSSSWEALWERKKVSFASLFLLLLCDSCSTLNIYSPMRTEKGKKIHSIYHFFLLFHFIFNTIYFTTFWNDFFLLLFSFPFPFSLHSSHKAFADFIFLLLLRFISIVASSHSVRLSILQKYIK